MLPSLLGLLRTEATQQVDRLVEAGDQFGGLVPTQRRLAGMALGRLYRRKGDELHSHRGSQGQFLRVVAGGGQQAPFGERPTGAGVFAQLSGGQVPTGSREVAQPLQRAFQHQLRLAGAESLDIDGEIAVFGTEHVRRAQLDQADARLHRLAYAADQLARLQSVRGDQVVRRQARGLDDRRVGGGELVVGQLARLHPGQRLALGAVGFAGKPVDLPDIEQDVLVGIVVPDLDQRPGPLGTDAQFLFQLTGQRRAHRLAVLHLAPGKLPQAALVLVFRPPGDQHPAIGATNHGRGDMYSFHGSSPRYCRHAPPEAADGHQLPACSRNAASYQARNAGH